MEYSNAIIIFKMLSMVCYLEGKCFHSRNYVFGKNAKNSTKTPDFWLEEKMLYNKLSVFIII